MIYITVRHTSNILSNLDYIFNSYTYLFEAIKLIGCQILKHPKLFLQ
jgi:hypothetical protein